MLELKGSEVLEDEGLLIEVGQSDVISELSRQRTASAIKRGYFSTHALPLQDTAISLVL